ncbi:MAG: hypothetical protein JO303_07445, partial [Caulobacteraceae bacterium]|nr:hypothetical protein [Caulobacteraceae bacterium]
MIADQPRLLRRIFRSATTSQNVIRELLQLVFLAELADPGEAVWIVSPWVSNIALLNNRAGGFDVVNPEWGRREVRLAEVGVTLMARGGRLIVVTRPDGHNRTFLERL